MNESFVQTHGVIDVSVYGWPGYQFYLIHIGALVSLTSSISVSSCLLVMLIKKSLKDFWHSPIGERMVVYLSFCDLAFSVSHTFDHVYMLVVVGHPPDLPCAIMGFFLNHFILAQTLMVSIMAMNALFLVVLEKRLDFGKYDYRLLAVAMGSPALLGILGAASGHLGQTGAWCYIDMRKPLGTILTNILGGTFLVVFLANMASYLLVWWKISQVNKAVVSGGETQSNKRKKYQRLAKVMMLFVAVFIGQWWAYVAMALWGIFGEPHVALVTCVVIFSNLGGVFNFIAYTLVRKKYQTVRDRDEGEKTRADQDNATQTTA